MDCLGRKTAGLTLLALLFAPTTAMAADLPGIFFIKCVLKTSFHDIKGTVSDEGLVTKIFRLDPSSKTISIYFERAGRYEQAVCTRACATRWSADRIDQDGTRENQQGFKHIDVRFSFDLDRSSKTLHYRMSDFTSSSDRAGFYWDYRGACESTDDPAGRIMKFQ